MWLATRCAMQVLSLAGPRSPRRSPPPKSRVRGSTITVHSLDRASGSLTILIFLYVYGPTSKTHLSEKLRSSYETVFRTLSTLEDLGLVSVHRETRFPFRQVCELSSSGKALAESPIYRWPSLFWQWSGEGLLRSPTH